MQEKYSTDGTTVSTTASFHVESANLRKLSMKQLDSFNDAISLARDALTGIVNQPRFHADRGVYNAAGDEVDDLISYLNQIQTLVIDIAKAAEPTEPSEAEERAWLLINYHGYCKDHLQDFGVIVAGLVAKQSHVEFHANRGGASK